MKTDRELLELAARAAGVHVERGRYGLVLKQALSKESRMGSIWNPLTDDGDALRLAVKLRHEIAIEAWGTGVITYTGAEFAEDGPDVYAATRRAIVRAAAAIGEAME